MFDPIALVGVARTERSAASLPPFPPYPFRRIPSAVSLPPHALPPYALPPYALPPYALPPHALPPYALPPYPFRHYVVIHKTARGTSDAEVETVPWNLIRFKPA